MDRSAWPIGPWIDPRIGPLSVLWTTATGRVVAVVVVVDNATLGVVTVAADGISGTTGISVHKVVVVVVAAADIVSSRAADIIRSVIRIMGVVVVRMARANSRRPRHSRWCRRNL